MPSMLTAPCKSRSHSAIAPGTTGSCYPQQKCGLASTVSRWVVQEFRRTALLVHNGIDAQRFRPGPRSPAPPTAVYTANNFAEVGGRGVGRRAGRCLSPLELFGMFWKKGAAIVAA